MNVLPTELTEFYRKKGHPAHTESAFLDAVLTGLHQPSEARAREKSGVSANPGTRLIAER